MLVRKFVNENDQNLIEQSSKPGVLDKDIRALKDSGDKDQKGDFEDFDLDDLDR